jgi:hypothetical protein
MQGPITTSLVQQQKLPSDFQYPSWISDLSRRITDASPGCGFVQSDFEAAFRDSLNSKNVFPLGFHLSDNHDFDTEFFVAGRKFTWSADLGGPGAQVRKLVVVDTATQQTFEQPFSYQRTCILF